MSSTRVTTISQSKLAQEDGSIYAQTWIGLSAVFTTWEGERLVGTITHWSQDGMFPCVTFDDGTWARLDRRMEIVND